MGDFWFTVLLVGVLVAVNALFAGSEMALISLREGQLHQLERQRGSVASATLVRLARDPNRFLATIQIGITLAGFLASATAAVALAEPLTHTLGFLGSAAAPVSIAIITVAVTFVTLVLGELTPKRLAMQYAQRWALLVARPLDLLARICRPLVWTLGAATDIAVRMLGGNPRVAKEQLSPAELRDLVAANPGLNTEQRNIILSALEIHERLLREVLVPRRAVFALPVDLPAARARRAMVESGHSRAPVVRDNDLDETIGVVNLRDLIVDGATLVGAARPPMLFPDTVRVSDALRRFRDHREQFALVVNEYGGVDGIVTIEDLLEEVVGEIYDETDRDISAVRHEADGALVLPGTFPLRDLTDLGVELAETAGHRQTTIAGLMLAVLGHLPSATGERVMLAEWTLEVSGIDGHTITAVRLRKHPQRPPK